jgi:hypothetical protein
MRAATPALESLMSATVRVGGGTGVLVANGQSTVVVTANHAATSDVDGGRVRVWTPDGMTDCSVYERDEASDLAILEAPREADRRGLVVLDRELLPGEEVWTSGYPRGWKGTEAPALCRGIVAGVGEEHWANLEASWGNSGGALMRVEGDGAMLGGLALGRAGDADGALDSFRGMLSRVLDKQSAQQKNVEEVKEKIASIQKRQLALRAGVRNLIDDKGLKGPKAAQILADLDEAEAEYLDWRIRFEGVDTRVLMNQVQFEAFSLTAEFIEMHFRTGFVRFAGATAIRKLLGAG